MDKLLHTNIKTVSRLLFDGAVKPTELLNLALKKIEETKHLNAFISVTSEQAKLQANESERRHKEKKPLSELDGVVIAVKDNFCTEGINTTCASNMLENFVPSYNATVCQRLFNAGAILIGKTNLDQFAMGSATIDSIHGSTKNIWKLTNDDFYIAGGSSGGSAVAVAAGTCFAALGSDTGGSTRNPASYCGIVGLKPTYGLVSRVGLIPLVNSMDVPGILTRTVDDAVSVLNVIAGYDEKDSTSLTRPYRKIRLPPASKMSIKGLKIGIPVEYNSEHVCDEVLDTWNELAVMLQNEGAVIKEVSMPNTEYSVVCYHILNRCEVASNMARYDGIEYGYRANEESSTEKLYATTRKMGFNDVVKNRILSGNYFLLSRNYDKYFNQALKTRRLISNDFHNVWDEVSLLLTPTTLTEAPSYKNYVKNYDPYKSAFEDFCTQAANMAGVPAVSIPIKLSKNGLPLSLQLMGRNLSEPMLLAVAKYIENLVKFPHFQHKS
ncbi:glutamyl-tRNA(Gln) amidotransferase subunit A, mitochondrial [Diabrotica virgifera virgifera]|uniref:Glutamyl-tRNA(Gln) amidotransferase subunit A, mitochondrial n=1 Tax=Diabrotica virgifera virgifera TaxID=50390 RepID=A0A6P7GMS3_DIAVI|nr:glutamyl-tRNA(Gln) amidotransferase subunit A, mitochondrial [Diabrotica virgifera virgifera]